MTPAAKLEALRARMKDLDLDVYLVPSDDPHLSEYVPTAYERRAFLTGFKGSAGTAVITQDAACLWTDSRYWNEAGLQLDPDCWTLQKAGLADTLTIPKWLAAAAVKKYGQSDPQTPLKVGMDPFVHAASFAKELETAFAEAAADELNIADGEATKIGVLDTSNENLVDPIWTDRPEVPTSPFRVHPMEYAGVSLEDKITAVRKEMKEKKATMTVLCTLDDVAYFLNMRAMGDIDTCPVGIAYVTVEADQISLYCDPRKVESSAVQSHLNDAGVTIKPYDSVVAEVDAHCQTAGNKVWIDLSRANYALSAVIPEKSLINSQNAVTPMKACKNDAELEGIRKAHIVDGVAMAKFMAWLTEEIVGKGRSVSEVEIDEVLTSCRAEQPGFKEVSFPTIAGVGPNGAIVHYRASTDSDLMRHLDTVNPILIDSGGQYEYGTTDVTRTWHFGKPTDEFVDYYTRVLKGNIGVDVMQFPENTPGFVLDVLARQNLWAIGKDYGHGTGHGVGAALNVHEGPMGISPRWTNKEVLKNGMVLSNEPGYYEDGKFGIRIENLMEIQYVNPGHNNAEEESSSEKKFFKFSKLTMIPIQTNLINVDLLSADEMNWLDSYHEEVLEKVSPHLDEGSPALQWLQQSCKPIDRKGR
jgi:Xaa-Pro aminopeptidase